MYSEYDAGGSSPSERTLLLHRTKVTKGIAVESSIIQMTAYLRRYFAQKQIVHQCDAAVVMGLLADEIEADTFRMEVILKRRVLGGTAQPSEEKTQGLDTEGAQLAELRRLEFEVENERKGLIKALQEKSNLAQQIAQLSNECL